VHESDRLKACFFAASIDGATVTGPDGASQVIAKHRILASLHPPRLWAPPVRPPRGCTTERGLPWTAP